MSSFQDDSTDVDWRPDWRNHAAYTDHGDDLYAWAYEFLRRNPEYREDYAKWDALPRFYDAGGHTPKEGCRGFGDFTPMIFFVADPAALPNETYGEYRTRTGNDDVEALETFLLKKWGLAVRLPDPEDDNTRLFFEIAEELPPYPVLTDPDIGRLYKIVPNSLYGQAQAEYVTSRLMIASWDESIDEYVHAFGIDLRYDIQEQLDTIRAICTQTSSAGSDNPASSIQPLTIPKIKVLAGAHVGLLRAYLRVFDAGVANAKNKDIRNVIYAEEVNSRHSEANWEDSGDKWVRGAIKKAESLVDGGYRALLKKGSFSPEA